MHEDDLSREFFQRGSLIDFAYESFSDTHFPPVLGIWMFETGHGYLFDVFEAWTYLETLHHMTQNHIEKWHLYEFVDAHKMHYAEK